MCNEITSTFKHLTDDAKKLKPGNERIFLLGMAFEDKKIELNK